MVIPAITGQLAGQLPLIAMAGVTVKYKEAMLPNGRGRRAKSKGRRSRGRRSFFGGVSPF